MRSFLLCALLTLLPRGLPTPRQEPSPSTERAAIESAVAGLVDAAGGSEPQAFLEAWDVERMLTHLVGLLGTEHEFLAPGSSSRAGFLAGLRLGLRSWTASFQWTEFEVLRVSSGPAQDEATALVRVRQSDAFVVRVRLWLVRGADGWRPWDFEDITGGLRATTLMVPLLAHVLESDLAEGGALPPWLGPVRELLAGLEAIGIPDVEGARQALAATEGVEFPPEFAAIRVLLLASVEVAEARYVEALAAIAAAPKTDLPVLDYLAAAAHNALGESEPALACARRFLESVGDDAEGRLEEGFALASLGRQEEALAAFRAGLAEDPRGVELLVELGCALPANGKAELGRRLVASGDPTGTFEPVVVGLLGRGEREAARACIAALREVAPDDPDADYYTAEMLADDGRHAEAAELLASALPSVTDPDERAAFEVAYLARMDDAGRPLEGYEALGGSDFAFEQLGDLLAWNGNGAALLQLAEAHERRNPDHQALALTRARALALLERRGEAEQAFVEAMARVAPEELDEVRRERVANLFEAGAWRRAYAQVPPVEDTFDDLAWAFQVNGDADGLEALVALHRESGVDPQDAALARWSAEVPWMRGQYEQALELLRAHEAVLVGADDLSSLYFWEDRVVRCLLRLGRLDEAASLGRRIDERDDDPFYVALALAVAGRTEPAAEAMRRLLADGYYQPWELYEDEDFGPALRAEGAGALREVAPPP